MANKILVTGYSGTGKTYSLATLDPKETFIICPDEKAPPFRGWKKNYLMADETGKFNPNTCNYLKTTNWEKIRAAMAFVSKNRPDIKTMGDNVYKTLKSIDTLREELNVIVMAHTEVKSFNGVDRTVFGVPGGKLVQDVVKPAGMFSIILETVVEKKGEDINYGFMTQNNTTNMAKSPADMFTGNIIPNDMAVVLESIRKFEEGE